MKDQYVGDINDYRKYGLLRSLTNGLGIKLGVCWMLTENDGSSDGEKTRYLQQPFRYRHYDGELFDLLQVVVQDEQGRGIGRIESSNIFDNVVYHSPIVPDGLVDRGRYFAALSSSFSDVDLIFFDPDNGIVIKSKPKGRKDSKKYVYWDEISTFFKKNQSILIYQHFPQFTKREPLVEKLLANLNAATSAHSIFAFRTPHVLFLLASHEKHVASFREGVLLLGAKWTPEHIYCFEYTG